MKLRIPTVTEIIHFYEEFHTPPHIREHCGMVEYVAFTLGKEFQKKEISVNLDLIKAAALLHDFVRVVDFKIFDPAKFPFPPSEANVQFWTELREKYKGWHHADVGAEVLEAKGFPEVAKIVRSHRFLQIEKGFDSWEEKIVYYADKRVKHASVVSLQERLEEGRKRNAPETIASKAASHIDAKVFALEKEIMNVLGFSDSPQFLK